MRKLLFFTLLFSSLAQAAQPEAWIAGIQAREGKIRRELLHIQSEMYDPITTEEKWQFHESLKGYREDLGELEREIQKTYDEQFWAGADEAWKDVLQQADALQSLNREILQDLEGQLHRLR